ncbi:MAG: ComF family protein [Nitrospirales bacterium]|nr:ComF family protein [Nitrospira sp.]MDR4500256.1 ComF family protein [Nitrospirales bacterium]
MHPPAFSGAWTLYPYESSLKKAIGLLKYRGKVSLAKPMAHLLATGLPSLPTIDLVMAVPLHSARLREREYNQSLLLAYNLSKIIQLPLDHTTLIRTRQSTPQTLLSRKERLKNLRRTFAVKTSRDITGKSILLVDDVYTTGTTVNECAKALRKAGSGDVYVVTLARML